MVKISPAETERYHLSLLLLKVKGATCYADLRTVRKLDGLRLTIRRYATFAEACLARGLIRDDKEWKNTLEEANSFEMPWKLQDLFALILVHCNSEKPNELCELFKDALSEDYARNHGKEIAYAKAYRDIARRIIEAGKTLADFPTMEQIDDLDADVIEEFNRQEQLDLGQRGYEMLNEEQKLVVNKVLNDVEQGTPAFYFFSGCGGTGKTYVNKNLVHLVRGNGKDVSITAFTGMAATLLPSGRTLHNRFGLNLDMCSSKIGLYKFATGKEMEAANNALFVSHQELFYTTNQALHQMLDKHGFRLQTQPTITTIAIKFCCKHRVTKMSFGFRFM